MSYRYETEEFNLTPKEQESARFMLREVEILNSQRRDNGGWHIRYMTFEGFKYQFYQQLATRLVRTWKNLGISSDGKRAIYGKVVRDS